jgi:hypothetical protein
MLLAGVLCVKFRGLFNKCGEGDIAVCLLFISEHAMMGSVIVPR